MKRSLIALAALFAITAQAANFVQVEQENVSGRKGADGSSVTYQRAGKDIGDYTLGVQARTARFDAGGIASSLETTVSNKKVSAFGITPFVGVARDFGGDAAHAPGSPGRPAARGDRHGPGAGRVPEVPLDERAEGDGGSVRPEQPFGQEVGRQRSLNGRRQQVARGCGQRTLEQPRGGPGAQGRGEAARRDLGQVPHPARAVARGVPPFAIASVDGGETYWHDPTGRLGIPLIPTNDGMYVAAVPATSCSLPRGLWSSLTAWRASPWMSWSMAA